MSSECQRELEGYVTKREMAKFYRQFIEALREVTRSLFPGMSVHGVTSERAHRGEQPKARRSLYWRGCSLLSGLAASLGEKARTTEVPTGLWIAAILIFGFADSLTSALVFAAGGYQANPLMASVVRFFGGTLWAFILVKTVILTALFFLSYYMLPRHSWLIPALLCTVGTSLVINNLIALFALI